jgi:hypothetical protein
MYFVLLVFFVAPFLAPNNGMTCPHMLPPHCASSPTSKLLQKLTLGQLLCLLMKGRPPKAWAPPLSLFLNGLHFGAPSKGTSHGNCKPATGRLLWTDGELRHQDLRALLASNWREREKLLEDRVAVAHVGCFVLCLLCCGLWSEQA